MGIDECIERDGKIENESIRGINNLLRIRVHPTTSREHESSALLPHAERVMRV